MLIRFLMAFMISVSAYAAQKPAEAIVVVDELLFDLNGEGVTNYDFKIFEEVSRPLERYFSDQIISAFQNKAEFYVFCSLALREADQLDIQADTERVQQFIQNFRESENSKKAEAQRNEIRRLFRVAEIVSIKERQLQNRQAIITWLHVLKRKYTLGWKSNDFKNRIQLGI
jgi:hypothetical protein